MWSQPTFDDCGSWILVCYVRKNRRATLPQVAKNVNAGRDQQEQPIDIHSEGYYSRDAVHKPLVINVNADLREMWTM